MNTDIPRIESNDQLEVGEHYHCFDRVTAKYSVEKCSDEGEKYLARKIWATDDNNQALERWDIYGPIKPPSIGGMYLCPSHGGFGFSSDCVRCKYLINNEFDLTPMKELEG